MFVETLEAVSTGVSAIELSGKLLPKLKRIYKWLKDGELKIAVVGVGGTGKTTLGKLLSGEIEQADLFFPYRESITFEEYRLESNVVGSVIVAPGQKRRQDSWGDLLRSIADGEFKLIIYTVSWGYHSFGEVEGSSYQQHPLFQAGMQPEEFVALYAKESRLQELEVLKKLEPYLSIANLEKTVLITLVTKQDLWWSNRQQVKKYYTEGDYEGIIQQIRHQKGAANFTHECLSASLVLENFMSGANELLLPTTAGYDEKLKVANFNFFLEFIETLFDISIGV